MNDPDLREPEPTHMPSQLWQPWTLIVPAILLIPMLSLAFAWQISPSDDTDLRIPRYHHPRTAEAPEVQPTPEPTASAPVPQPKITYFVPDSQGMLHAKTFSTLGGSGEPDFVELGKKALENLFPDAPDYFPAGTQLQTLTQDESEPSLVRVSLNDKFWHSNYWAGESRVDAAMQAIAHTLEAAYQQTGGSGTVQVQLLSNGKIVDSLGEFDARQPYSPDPTLVADKSSLMAPVTKP
jgi:hypothetical protein